MSETAPEGTPAGTNSGEQPPSSQQPASQTESGQNSGNADQAAEVERLRGELRKFRGLEDRLKALKPKAEKFDELQRSVMTAEERAQAVEQAANERVSTAETRATAAERQLAVLTAAIEHKLDKEDLVFLEGLDADKVPEAAKKLAKRLGRADTPNFDGGTRTNPPATDDIGDFLRTQIDRARGRR